MTVESQQIIPAAAGEIGQSHPNAMELLPQPNQQLCEHFDAKGNCGLVVSATVIPERFWKAWTEVSGFRFCTSIFNHSPRATGWMQQMWPQTLSKVTDFYC